MTNESFGPLIAYLLPGATALFGLSHYSPTLQAWFAFSPADAPTIGGFLYLTVASLGAGMTVSACRWLIIDRLHHATGIPSPPLDFAKLGKNVTAFAVLIDIHYRHYQFHANMFVAVALAYVGHRLQRGVVADHVEIDMAVALTEVIFFVTSRDNLRKYYARSRQLLAPTRQPRR